MSTNRSNVRPITLATDHATIELLAQPQCELIAPSAESYHEARAAAVRQFERDFVKRLMAAHPTIAAAARAAGLNRRNLQRLLARCRANQ
jgi:hypothetical protein